MARSLLLALSLAFAVAGCSGKRHVEGKVVYKSGGQPVPNLQVYFESVLDPKVVHAGYTNAQGRFVLNPNMSSPVTIEPGDYRVILSPYIENPGADSDKPIKEEFVYSERIKVVPRRYLDARTTDLTCTIKPDQFSYPIEIDRPSP